MLFFVLSLMPFAALETTCLNWPIDLWGSTKLIIAPKALQLTQGVLWCVRKLLYDALCLR
jgi:hypothetical protein